MEISTEPQNLAPLIALAHHRWNIPIIAELYRHSGAKYITLVNRLGVSRASLSASLADLIELGLVRKNPGYGHPMRPEYLLTRLGESIGAQCMALTGMLRRNEDTDLAFKKWTLPLVAVIGEETRRFNELREQLSAATPRAIAIGLKALQEQQWVNRNLIDDYPPAAGYRLKRRGRRILKCVDDLCAIL